MAEGEKEDESSKATAAKEEPAKNVPDEVEQLKERLLRLAAEFDNYKKRVAKEIDGSKAMGKAEVIKKILPAIDEFELALSVKSKDDEHNKGMELVFSNLLGSLKASGLKEMPAEGKFDPYKHEILVAKESDKPDGTILEVVRKGYMLNDMMLRPASVIISKLKDNDKKDEKQGE